MLVLVLALPKLNIGTKKQYEIFHVPLPLNVVIVVLNPTTKWWYIEPVIHSIDNKGGRMARRL